MKNLFDFIRECDTATPANTMGMGNPMSGDSDGNGSEPLPKAKAKKERRKKRRKSEEE